MVDYLFEVIVQIISFDVFLHDEHYQIEDYYLVFIFKGVSKLHYAGLVEGVLVVGPGGQGGEGWVFGMYLEEEFVQIEIEETPERIPSIG